MKSNLALKDFQLIAVIGKGTYAKVKLGKCLIDDKHYALKVLKKKYIIQTKQVEHIMTEKQILSGVRHPFLVQLKASFQDEKNLYFVLEYCPGGQLFQLLATRDKISQNHARFYAAQIVLALEQLHKNKIIYRDLKPQNIIIDKMGYVKLTDFGLSKILEDQAEIAKSICGTPQYLAPQIIRKEGHNMSVDWWCLGCLIHQMVTGYPPFNNQNRKQLFEQIVHKNVKLSKFSPNLQDLLKRILDKDSKKRLGYTNIDQIKTHPWFKGINWANLTEKKQKAPFVPKLKSDIDLVYSVQFTSASINSYEDEKGSPVGPEDQDMFSGFQYANSK